ncbi:MAG TPA: helix-turn-helix transcriptional regulator [Solirubrobacteraceae bacterium]|jgi:transcriptional regulator with XRE-family HTH domain|nr:helix-turn-helix transcriptional regulator [Solirubrobacteraceae bacterium]
MTDPELPSAEDYASLGRALRALRRDAALTQKEAAVLIGVRDTFVSQIENGRRGMRWHTLLAFIDAYNADLHVLANAIERDERQRPRRRLR